MGLLLLCPSFGYAETGFKDIPESYWAAESIDFLNGRGILAGYKDQTFHPDRPVNRAEFAVILAKSQGLGASPTQKGTHPPVAFTDVPASHWAAPAIQAMVEQGWMSGYPGKRFRPNQALTMAEMYVILSKANTGDSNMTEAQADEILRFYRDGNKLPSWAKVSVANAIQSGITITERSKTKLFPNSQAVRANVAVSVAKLVNPALRDNPAASVAQKSTLDLNQLPAANLVGVLETGDQAGKWILVRADGRQFRLNPGQLDTSQWQAGQQARITGNLDAVTGTATDPIVTVQTFFPITPAPAQAAESVQTTTPVTGTPPVAEPVAEKIERTGQTEPVEITQEKTESVEALKQTQAPQPKQDVVLYFPNLANLVSDPALMLGEPVRREADNNMTPRKAVEAILQGPSEAERRQGYFMDEDVKRLSLGKLTVAPKGIAAVTLEAPGDFQFSNSSVPARLSEQIRRTLKEFDGVQSVSITVQTPKHKDLWISP